jgi:hypothetical protein
MFERMLADAETGNWGRGPVEGDYDEATVAHRTAFLYVLTGDRKWAEISRRHVERRISDTRWANRRLKGLALYYHGRSVALAYDWCHGSPAWDAAFSQLVSKKLLEQADLIFQSGGTEQNAHPASNWQGIRWSIAGLCYLATDEPYPPENLDRAHSRVERYLVENLGREGSGWNIEGLGYNYFPLGGSVAPYAVAIQRHDPTKDLRLAGAARHTLWTVYAPLVKTPEGLRRPDFGDDNPGANSEGAMGFAFWFSPPDLHPGLKWWYDRTVGTLGDGTFDNARIGTIPSILYYPQDLPAKPPLEIPEWRALFDDSAGNGFFTWRNAYQDEDDVVAQMYVKRHGNKGHSGPDALSFRIAGLGTLWATGGGRYGPKTGGQDVYLRGMNTLYPVDPDSRLTVSGGSGRVLGQPLIKPDGGGHLVSRIDLSNLNVRNHQRWFIADHSSGPVATYVIGDTSEDGRYWQLNTLATHTVTTSGNTFTLTHPNGDTLLGTVLHPPGPVTFSTGTRPRGSAAGDIQNNRFIHFQSEDGHHLVVLTLAKKASDHPSPTLSGSWDGSSPAKLTIGSFSVRIEGDQITYP